MRLLALLLLTACAVKNSSIIEAPYDFIAVLEPIVADKLIQKNLTMRVAYSQVGLSTMDTLNLKPETINIIATVFKNNKVYFRVNKKIEFYSSLDYPRQQKSAQIHAPLQTMGQEIRSKI